MNLNRMKWYGKEHLNPEHTKKLTVAWQAPPGNCHDYYYDKFPDLYPHWLPADHHIVNYKEELYPKHRDYRTFKSAPKEIKSKHQVEWEDGYGACNACGVCLKAKQENDEIQADYYQRLEAWKITGTPM
jgi:hypothetical protein